MRRAWLAFAACALFACRTLPPSLEVAEPLPPTDPRPREFLAALQRSAEARHSVRARVRIKVDAPELRYHGSQRIAAQKPAKLRIEMLGLFQQTAAVLATDGSVYSFYDAAARRGERGPVHEGLLWTAARVDLAPIDAVALLTGGAAPAAQLIPGPAERVGDGGIRLRLDDGRGWPRERVGFDLAGRMLGLEKFDARGRLLWQAEFGEYVEIGGASFAKRIDLYFPATGARAALQFEAVELNPELSQELFELRWPSETSGYSAKSGGERG